MADKTNNQAKEKLKLRPIVSEMEESYLDYAMSVIVARALPDVRDGLKPVHRRILYAMNNLGLRSSSRYRKSATVVGEVIGKYHPHGDTAVYDSMVHLAQDFSMRYPIVHGQGNFGSMDGDRAAAMRYTEAKMYPIAEEMIRDIERETVDWQPNYDASTKEPKILPSVVPQLLINGTMGIAVGMATEIPPHNLSEVVDALVYMVGHPDTTVEDLAKLITGPDFPTGGVIYNQKDIISAYATGKGSIVMRGRAEIEEAKTGQFRIIVNEIPYKVNKADMIVKIAELVKAKKIDGIRDLRDESDRDGVRVVVELKKDAYPKKVLNQLYSKTSLQTTMHVNMVALVDGIQPRVLNLEQMCRHFLDHREVVVIRRAKFDLAKAKERAHILEGLKKALDHIDAVVKTIKQSPTKEKAKHNLMKKFKLSNRQADAILEMKLSTLAGLERKKVSDELEEKLKLIKHLETLLKSKTKIYDVVKDELIELKKKFGDERRTKVVKRAVSEFKQEDLIPNEEAIVMLTRGGYVKRMGPSTYRAQHRGGKGVRGAEMKEEDIVKHLFTVNTHDDLLFFTNLGRVFQTKAYEIPEASRTAKGQAIVNFLQLGGEERVQSMVAISDFQASKFLFMATKHGTVKKVKIEDFAKVRRSGLIAMRLKKGDELRWVRETNGQDQIMLFTSRGQAIRFKESDARPMGRSAAGVRGIRLKKNDELVGVDVIYSGKDKDCTALVVTENGYGKQTQISTYKVQRRGGSGIKTASINRKTGQVRSAFVVSPEDECEDILSISTRGQVIRCSIKSVNIMGRATQGVRLMRLDKGDAVASVTCL